MSWGGTYHGIAQLALVLGARGRRGGFLFFLLSEEKQFQLQGKLGTSTKATTVMSSSTKRNINGRRRWSEQQQRCSEMRAALERLCSPFESR